MKKHTDESRIMMRKLNNSERYKSELYRKLNIVTFVDGKHGSIENIPDDRYFDMKEITKRMSCLSEMEKAIISSRYGLFDKKLKTLKETCLIFGLTTERLRQREQKALEKMRQFYE